jgi:hypothetical protein
MEGQMQLPGNLPYYFTINLKDVVNRRELKQLANQFIVSRD